MQPTGKIRFDSFSDGVFAIAITLLALELHVPHFENGPLSQSLEQVIPLIPSVLTFVLSFVTIAIFWVNHQQLTQNLTVITKRRILWGNMLFLLFVTIIPFVTTAVSSNPRSSLAALFYSLILFGASVSFSILRYYVHRSCTSGYIKMSRSIIGPCMYLVAVAASLVSVWAAYVLLAIPALYYFLPKGSSQ